MEGGTSGGRVWRRQVRAIILASAVAVSGLYALEHAGAEPVKIGTAAAKVKPTTTSSSTSSTSSSSTTTTTIRHCGDGTGDDSPKNKHCRPPSPHA